MSKYLDNEIVCTLSVLGLGYTLFNLLAFMTYGMTGYSVFEFCGTYIYPQRVNGADVSSTLFFIAALLFFALIVRSTAHYHGSRVPSLSFMDKVPVEIFLAVFLTIAVVCMAGGFDLLGDAWFIYERNLARFTEAGHQNAQAMAVRENRLPYQLFLWLYAGAYGGVIFSAMTVIARLKCHSLLQSSIVYKVMRWCWNITKTILHKIYAFFSYWFGFVSQFFKNLTYLKKLVLYTAVLYLVLLLLYGRWHWRLGAYYWIAFTIACAATFAIAVRMSLGYEKIRTAIQQISDGDTNYKTDTKYMTVTMAEQARNLNNIGRAVQAAAEKQVRSEKLKAELITNVSHDIKTPLTSIISYIDLLGKEEFDSPTAREYIDILEKQAVRLKKLLNDVVEASKASTGNVQTEFGRIDLSMAISQAVGEYADRAQRADLTLDVSLPEEDLYIYSDGRLLWRIFDNLLGNACKYSMPGTRVYISCQTVSGKHIITFKNISKTKLNISPDELMERFVRGDSSRNTEGSGLGLSIAQSLAGILNGEMKLSIDGDLFKATLVFDAV